MYRRYLAFIVMIAALTLASQIQYSAVRNSLPGVSALETSSMLGIYWDGSCTQRVSSIRWGVLSPGERKLFSLYVRNEGNMTVSLILNASNWVPADASRYLSFSWRSNNRTVEVGKTAKVNLTLLVSRNIRGILDFAFDVVVGAVKYVPGDANNDGVVDVLDIVTISLSYGSNSSSSNWNFYADLNFDGLVDIFDLVAVSIQFRKS